MMIQEDPFLTLNHEQISVLNVFVRFSVDFLVVGGYAMRAHGSTRITCDLDLVVSQSSNNLAAIDFAFATLPNYPITLPSEVLRYAEGKVTFGSVEVFASMRDLDYFTIREAAVIVSWRNSLIPVISKHWIKNAKQLAIAAVNRSSEKKIIDQQDLEFLERQ